MKLNNPPSASLDRRSLLRTSLGSLALRSIASGLPASLLLSPRPGRAQADPLASGPGRMLVVFTSQAGDPINANVPGTYGEFAEEVVHPEDPAMEATQVRLREHITTAARPWAELPQYVLDQTCFFHHATYTPVHQDQPKVMRLMGATDDDEMLVSLLAKLLAPRQGAVQALPLSLGARAGGELLTAQSRVLANVGPRSIARALGGADGPLASMHALRDREIDRIHKVYRSHGNVHDRRLLDAWARSRDEVRTISDELVGRLSAINNDGEDSQVVAASVLAAMNITPVITVRGRFGGDNHTDPGLARETDQTVTGVARIGRLRSELDNLKLQGVLRHDVIIGSINVFGRTLMSRGTEGRDHNRGHHCAILMGPGIRGSVVGGLERSGNDYRSTSIDPDTGGRIGSIPYDESLASMAKTLGVALGVDETALNAQIKLGQPVRAALA
ncbi:MAG: hypothetical protein AAFZ18_06430 [Myxococcota bacterium]